MLPPIMLFKDIIYDNINTENSNEVKLFK